MATQVAIAKMREDAMRRLAEAMTAIGQSTNIEAAVLPLHNRDAGYLHAEQLATIASWLEGVAQSKPAELTDAAFGTELARRMVENGITTQSTKADIVAFLEVYIGDTG